MPTQYYTVSGQPVQISRGLSQPIRAEFAAIEAAFAAMAIELANATASSDFGQVYQGASATDPTQRRDGTPLQNGDLYLNTVGNVLKAFSNSEWYAPVAILENVMLKSGGAFTGGVTGTTISISGAMAAASYSGSLADMTGMTSGQVTTALGYTPLNRAGGTMTGALNGTAATYSGTVTAANIIHTSDERLKKNWKKITDAQLDAFLAVKKMGFFTFKKNGAQMMGAGAQSVLSIFPEAGSVDEYGNLGLAYGAAALPLVHKLGNRVKELEKRLAKLEK